MRPRKGDGENKPYFSNASFRLTAERLGLAVDMQTPPKRREICERFSAGCKNSHETDATVTSGGLSVGVGEDHKSGAVEHVGVVLASTSATTQVAFLDVLQHLRC